MADSVSRLKELLFQQESATLSDLARRIDEVSAADRAARAELAETGRRAEDRIAGDIRRVEERVVALDARAGTPANLRSSVAEVLDDAIIEARETKQDELARALAPMMIKTIKAELKNNQAEMVEALYPITGQLVKAYVASAMKDLTARMDRRLQSNRFMLWLRSLFSGYSMAELALADSQQLEVEELYLIRRGSGELLQRWPASIGRSNSDVHMTSVLSAINDFAAQAFQADGGHLRSFNGDDFTMYLRASPVYLLAAKCRGDAVPGVDMVFDAEFLEAVTRQHAAEDTGAASSMPPGRLLAELKSRLEDGIKTRHEVLARAGLPFNLLRAITATAMLAIVAALGWYGWTTFEVESTRAKARAAIAATEPMHGFPIMLEVGARGQSVTVTGMAPSQSAKSELLASLGKELPGVVVADRGIAVLPAAGPDLRPQLDTVRRDLGGLQSTVKSDIGGVEATMKRDLDALRREMERAAALRSLERAQRRIEEALPDLQLLSARRSGAMLVPTAEKALSGIRTHTAQLRTPGSGLEARAAASAALAQSTRELLAAAASVSPDAGRAAAPRRPAARLDGANLELADVAQEISLAAERLAAAAAAATQIAPPSARERLRAFASSNAVFFANNEDYRDAARAQRVIAELSQLAKDAGAVVRVIGYTDERGTQNRNSPLALARAEKVVAALLALGVPRNRLVAVGRASGPDISPSTGPESANRRVEFELGFDGEVAAP